MENFLIWFGIGLAAGILELFRVWFNGEDIYVEDICFIAALSLAGPIFLLIFIFYYSPVFIKFVFGKINAFSEILVLKGRKKIDSRH